MDDTLRLLESLRDAASPGGSPSSDALAAFIRLLDGSPRAREIAAGAALEAAGTPPPAFPRARAFRAAYRAATGLPAGRDPIARSGALALEGILDLPREQRAALALQCVVGLTAAETAFVLGTAPGVVRALTDAAIDAVRAAAVRPAASLLRGAA